MLNCVMSGTAKVKSIGVERVRGNVKRIILLHFANLKETIQISQFEYIAVHLATATM